MVGKLGETAIAAVGTPISIFFFMMFMIGLSAGCAVFIAVLGDEGCQEHSAHS